MVEDLVEFPEEDEIPVSVATNGQNLVFVGTNAALYEFNIKTKIVSLFKLSKVLCTLVSSFNSK